MDRYQKKIRFIVDIKKVRFMDRFKKRSDSWIDIKKKRSDLWIDIFKKVRFMGRYHNISVKVIKIKNISDCLNQEQNVKIF